MQWIGFQAHVYLHVRITLRICICMMPTNITRRDFVFARHGSCQFKTMHVHSHKHCECICIVYLPYTRIVDTEHGDWYSHLDYDCIRINIAIAFIDPGTYTTHCHARRQYRWPMCSIRIIIANMQHCGQFWNGVNRFVCTHRMCIRINIANAYAVTF